MSIRAARAGLILLIAGAAPAAGCLIEPRPPALAPAPFPDLAPATLDVAPAEDETGGDLGDEGAIDLGARIASRLAADAAARRRRERPALDLAPSRAGADYRLEVAVTAWGEGSRVLWILPGLGAGKARYAFEARIVRAADATVVGRLAGARAAYRFLEASGGAGDAMLDEVADRVARFVTRRR